MNNEKKPDDGVIEILKIQKIISKEVKEILNNFKENEQDKDGVFFYYFYESAFLFTIKDFDIETSVFIKDTDKLDAANNKIVYLIDSKNNPNVIFNLIKNFISQNKEDNKDIWNVYIPFSLLNALLNRNKKK